MKPCKRLGRSGLIFKSLVTLQQAESGLKLRPLLPCAEKQRIVFLTVVADGRGLRYLRGR